VTAWFPGNNDYAASTSAPLEFWVNQQSTTLILDAPATAVAAGEPLDVTATLTDQSASELPLSEQAILFAIFSGDSFSCPATDGLAGGAGAAAYKTVITGLKGEAKVGNVDLASGAYTVCAYFRENPSYAGSSASGAVIINSAPVAVDDSYIINIDEGNLVVPAPGVLENDSDSDGDLLTASLQTGPTAGELASDALNADGSFTYSPPAIITTDSDSFTYQVCDPIGACDTATVTISFNHPPVCDNVEVRTTRGDYPTLWPTNKRETDIYLFGATDEEDDQAGIPLQYFFVEILQDEEIGDTEDAAISNGCSEAWVRSERDGQGDGRVYQIGYMVYDSAGASCLIPVESEYPYQTVDIATLPHDQGGDSVAIKGDILYSSGSAATCSANLP
jgi:hypothetical protein